MSRPHRSPAILRLECVAEEDRPLFVSYLVASLLAVSWVLLVHYAPDRLGEGILNPDDRFIIVVPPLVDLPLPAAVADARRRGRTAAPAPEARGAGNVRDFFTGNAGLVDAGTLLRGVMVEPSGSAAGEPTGKALGVETGAGSRTPGRSRGEGLSPAGGVGAVVGRGLSRRAVTVAPPEVEALGPGPSVGNASAVGQTARAYVPQLARCYYDEGLSRNPSLGGVVRLALTVKAGRVTSASIVDRSWVGAGAAEAESCLLQSVRGWRLGDGDARIVLPLSFTSPAR